MRPIEHGPGNVGGEGRGSFTNATAETQPMRPHRVVSLQTRAESGGRIVDTPLVQRRREETALLVPSEQILQGLSISNSVDRIALRPWDTAYGHATSENATDTRASLRQIPDYTDHVAQVVDDQRARASELGETPVNRDLAITVLATNHPDAPALDAFSKQARSLADADISDRDVEIILGAMREEVGAITIPVAEQRAENRKRAEVVGNTSVPDLPTDIPKDLADAFGIDPRTKVDPRYLDMLEEALDSMRDPNVPEEQVRVDLQVPTYGEYLDEEIAEGGDAGVVALVPEAEELDRIGEGFAAFAGLDNPRSASAIGVAEQLHLRAIRIAHGMDAERDARRALDASKGEVDTAATINPNNLAESSHVSHAPRTIPVHFGGGYRDQGIPTLDELKQMREKGIIPPSANEGTVFLDRANLGRRERVMAQEPELIRDGSPQSRPVRSIYGTSALRGQERRSRVIKRLDSEN